MQLQDHGISKLCNIPVIMTTWPRKYFMQQTKRFPLQQYLTAINQNLVVFFLVCYCIRSPGKSKFHTRQTSNQSFVVYHNSVSLLDYLLIGFKSLIVNLLIRSICITIFRSGCTQYHFGSGGTNYVYTFNNQGTGGRHLADQTQVICVR